MTKSVEELVSLSAAVQVIPEGAGAVKTTAAFGFAMFWSFLVLAGRVEVGVGVKARAEPDRVAAVGGLDGGAVRRMVWKGRKIVKGLVLLSAWVTGWSLASSVPVSRCGAGG